MNHEVNMNPPGSGTLGKKKVPKQRFLFWKILGAGVVLYCLALVTGLLFLMSGGRTVVTAATNTGSYLAEYDFASAKDGINDVQSAVNRVQIGLSLLSLTRPIPVVGNQVKGLDSAVEAMQESIEAFDAAVDIGADVYGLTDGKITEASSVDDLQAIKPQVFESFLRSEEELEQIRLRLSLANQALQDIETDTLIPQFRNIILPIQTLLPELQLAAGFLADLSRIAPELGGMDGDRQWLVLFLNNEEMRPGGGFIGVYGLLLTRDAEIIDFTVNDVLAVDNLVPEEGYAVTPPVPIQEYLNHSNWYFRDSNWSPDFAESSETAVQLFRQQIAASGQPVPEIHGVIGFTPTAASAMLDIVGPIEIDGMSFNSTNVIDLIEFESEFNYVNRGLSFSERKQIVSRLTEEVVNALSTTDLQTLPRLVSELSNAILQKQIAITSFDERTQRAIVESGWGGVIVPDQNHDTLQIVDANMNASKTDPYIERKARYEVRPENGVLQAKVTLQYTHNGEYSRLVTDYRSFTRIFVPESSKLISVEGAEGEVLTEIENGRMSFGTYFAMRPGETHTITFTYALPDSVVKRRTYTLDIIKQMGAAPLSLTLDLAFDKKLKAAIPAEEKEYWGDDAYFQKLELNTDQQILLEF